MALRDIYLAAKGIVGGTFKLGTAGVSLMDTSGELQVKNSAASAFSNAQMDTLKLIDPANTSRSINLGAPTLGASRTVDFFDGAGNVLVDSVANNRTVQHWSFDSSALPAATYNNGTSGVGATLTANANGVLVLNALTNPAVGERILLKDQSTGFQNGIYVVTDAGSVSTPFILTRATDYDTSAKILNTVVMTTNKSLATNFCDAVCCTNTSAITLGTTAITYKIFLPTSLFTRNNTWTGNNNFVNNLTAPTSPTPVNTGDVGYSSSALALQYYDGSMMRSSYGRGYTPFAWQPGFSQTLTPASNSLAANGGTVLIPIYVHNVMQVASVSIWAMDTATARSWRWDLYTDDDETGLLNRVLACSGAQTFTPTVAAKRTITGASVLTITPGTYFLAIQNTSVSQTFGLGFTASVSGLATTTSKTKTLTIPNGSTLDPITATWTTLSATWHVVVNGNIAGANW